MSGTRTKYFVGRCIAITLVVMLASSSVAAAASRISAKTSTQPTDIASSQAESITVLYEQTPQRLRYSYAFAEPTLSETQLGGTAYTEITMPGALTTGQQAGQPALPMRIVRLLLPPNTMVKTVDVTGEKKELLSRGIDLKQTPVMPYQNPVPLQQKTLPTIDVDTGVYTSHDAYPSTYHHGYDVQYSHGYAILSMTLNPVSYIPAEGRVFYTPELTITITVQQTTDTPHPLYRNHADDFAWVQGLVDNPKVAVQYQEQCFSPLSYPGGLCDPSQQYDHVIITTTYNGLNYWPTSGSLPYNWQSLMTKHQTDDGLSCTLVTIQDITACTDYHNANPLFNDLQAHIREFCKDAYQDWGTSYILIGGDGEWIPARHMDTNYETDIDADIYWSNLDNTFNADQDSYWGEEGDSGFDLYSELFIGRLTCDVPLDVSNWMKKSFYYADSTDQDYLENAAFYGGDTTWDCQGDDFIDYSAIKGTTDWLGPQPHYDGPFPTWAGFQYGFETWNSKNPWAAYDLSVKWTADPPNPGGWQGGSESAAINGLKNAINTDQVTYISAIAHANPLMSLDVGYSSWESDYHNTKPFFIHDYGCHCGDFDDADDGVLHSMLFHSDTELAFGCVYNTCYGWGNLYCTNSSSAFQQKEFWDYLFDTTNNSGNTNNWQLGKAQAWSKDRMAPTINWDYSYGTWRAIIQGCMLFADPAQKIKPPVQHAHNLGVNTLDVSSHEPVNTNILVGASVYNNGLNDETNVDVQFRVNGTMVNSTTIPFFAKNTVQQVTWTYHTPPGGWETLCVNITPVAGETVLTDNQRCRDVIYGPDIAVTQIQAPDILGQGFPQDVKGYIENLGPTDETVTVEFYANTILEDTTSVYLTSGTGQWVTFSWDASSSGVGTYDVVIYAVPVPSETYLLNQQLSHTVTVFAAIGNVLLVDDDAGDTYESWYQTALLQASYVYERWDHSTQGSPSPSVMQTYTAVVWFTGDDYTTTLDSTDTANLQTYLNNGGKLFISGQDIGYDIHTSSFYTTYLHATYNVDTAGHSVVGETGDLIGDGLSFSISGGDGANNQNYPDGISPISPATSCFYYSDSTPNKAGIKVESGLYKLVYFGCGFEAIDNQADRTTVMSRVLAWFGSQHDIAVINLNVPDTVPNNQTTMVEATVRNMGLSNEVNIVVDFTVDSVVLDSITIPSLNSGQSTVVSFPWTPTYGTYLVGVEAQPVPGENILSNNALYKTVVVLAAPSIWVDPAEFNFYINQGGTVSDTLTVGNLPSAEGVLEFSTSILGGGGGWSEQWSYTYGGMGHSQLAQPVGDIDEDGHNETLVGGYASDTIIILSYNPVTQTYQEEYEWTEGGGDPSGACVVDLDNNGDLEFCVSWVYGSANGVYAYDWNGATLTELDVYSGVGFDFAFDIYACDYDEDGNTEVLIANDIRSGGTYHVTALGWNAGGFVYETSWSSGVTTETPMVWSGDTDGDSHIEVITSATENTVHALSWNGASWSPQVVAAGLPAHPYAIVAGDIDNDGIDEIGIGLEGTQAYIYDWISGAYTQVWSQNYAGEEDIIEAMYFGDADNDGAMEMIVGTDDIHVIAYAGGSYYEESLITQTEGQLAGAIIADMDDDGLNEVKACDIITGPGKEWIIEWMPGWLTVSPTSGMVPVGGSMGLTVTADSTGLAQGTYTATIVVSSNDPLNPVVYIPVTFTVSFGNDVGVSAINYPPQTIYAGSCLVNATVQNYGSLPQTTVLVNCSVYEGIIGTFLEEYFTGGVPPTGWSQEQSGEWASYNGNNAGGTAPEARLLWSAISGDYAYLQSAPVSTVGALTLTLEFKHFIDYYSSTFNCRVWSRASSTDPWTDVTPWSNPVSGNIGPQMCSVDISADIGPATQVRFEFDGYYWNLDYWYLDDVKIYSSGTLAARGLVYCAETTVSLGTYESTYVTFTPEWTTQPGNYLLEVTTLLPGDQNPANDASSQGVEVLANNPPAQPGIDGPASGDVGVEYIFETMTTDPENHQVYYQWDWDDGTPMVWRGPFTCGTLVAEAHTWTATGVYQVRVQAKDVWGKLSAWSNPLPFTAAEGVITLDLTVLLEGPYNGAVMSTALNTAGFLPLTQPYSGSPWFYPGTEAVPSIPNVNIVDWILIELRDAPTAAAATSATMIARQAAFLLNDGTVVGMDGASALEFDVTVTQNLFVVLWHRNHLSVMSATPLVETGGVYTYDFTTAAAQAYGGSLGHKEIGTGVWGMVGGDGNADSQVNNGDKNDIWSTQAGTSGYRAGDFDLNGQVQNQDKNNIWAPNTGWGSQVPS